MRASTLCFVLFWVWPLRAAAEAPTTGAALVIAVESYRDAPPALAAESDGLAFAALARELVGADNVRALIGAHATAADVEDGLAWLEARARVSEGPIWVFFSGHGSPGPAGALLLPWDADPRAPQGRGVALEGLLARVERLDTTAIVAIDACFSGQGPRSVFPVGRRPVLPASAPPAGEVVLLAATAANGTAGTREDGSHGLFSGALLDGLGGAADADRDGLIRARELARYVSERVSRESRAQRWPQRVQAKLAGRESLVLARVGLSGQSKRGAEASVVREAAPPEHPPASGEDARAERRRALRAEWALGAHLPYRTRSTEYGDDSIGGLLSVRLQDFELWRFSGIVEASIGGVSLDTEGGKPGVWMQGLQWLRLPLWEGPAWGLLPKERIAFDLGTGLYAAVPWDFGVTFNARLAVLWFEVGAQVTVGVDSLTQFGFSGGARVAF